jgi:hypothetical protein
MPDDRVSLGAESDSRLDAVRRLVGWANGDHICPECGGDGERFGDHDPDDLLVCAKCDGTGEIEL